MSKPESTGESLEAILAAIRKSLAEQSTGVLEETAPTSAEDVPGAAELREQRFSQWLPDIADVAEDQTPPESVPTAPPPDELAEEIPPPPPASIAAAAAAVSAPAAPVPPVAPAPAPPPKVETAEKADKAPTTEKTDKDPLWFLSRPVVSDKKEAAPAATGPAVAPHLAPASAAPPAAGAKSALKEIVRGPLPPFFGSSAEAAKVEVVPASPMPGREAALVPPVVTHPVQMVRAPTAEPSRPSVALESAPHPLFAAGSGGASEGASGAKASAPFAQPAGEGPAVPASGPTQIQGLEAMVAELLRPMLRRWLDENMPRLVSAALKAEAELMAKRDSGRDPKKP